MRTVVTIFLLCSFLLGTAQKQTDSAPIQGSVDVETTTKKEQNQTLLNKIIESLEKSKQSVWSKVYENYRTYQKLKEQEIALERRLKKLKRNRHKNKKEIEHLSNELQTIEGKLKLLHDYERDPFKKLLTPPSFDDQPTVTDPFAIIGALSYLEKIEKQKEEYLSRYNELLALIHELEGQKRDLEHYLETNDHPHLKTLLHEVQKELETLKPIGEIMGTTFSVYSKKFDEVTLSLKDQISKETQKALFIAGVILLFLVFMLIIKYFVRRYMSDNERFYIINKAINITFIFLSLLTILFAYLENVSYLVTILGFASAGIAIALKDWFMSILGWFAIVLGGSIHVGDRVRFVKDGVEYVGDIVDISLLRMTMHEDVTLVSYMNNRRAGRFVFIPNNVVFTDMIANYSHGGLKTVWDGIDFTITFDSDIHRATQIAKEVTRKYAKGYTDLTRKQLNRLRSHYSIRNTNVEPRIFTHIEAYGVKVSVWYLTNSYATMTLRSTISNEIVRSIRMEDCIRFAYPTHSLYVDRGIPKPECRLEDYSTQENESTGKIDG